MRRFFDRTTPAPADVVGRADLRAGEKVLAAAGGADGTWLLGTRDALHLVPESDAPTRLPWEQVQAADWSRDDDRLRVVEVGDFGAPRRVHEVVLAEADTLLALVRERVTASVVLQRRVELAPGRGLQVIARRAPSSGDEVLWAYELDPGLDPEDSTVRAAAEAGLRAAAEELGLA